MSLSGEAQRRLKLAMRSSRFAQELSGRLGSLGQVGKVFYCDPTSGSDNYGGERPDNAKATMNAAIGLCTSARGDVIVRMRGTETVTETIAFDVSGVTVIPEVQGFAPWFNGEYFATLADAAFVDGPVATVTASGVTLAGLGFAGRDTGATFYGGAALLLGGAAAATPYGTYIYGCRFPKWGLDNRIGIAIEGSTNVTVERCDFEGVGASFDSGIYVQGATQNLNILDNHFRQCTYGVLFGDFAGGGPHCLIKSNLFEDSKILSAASAATGLLADNWSEGATDTGSYSATVDTLNSYGLIFSDNHYAE